MILRCAVPVCNDSGDATSLYVWGSSLLFTVFLSCLFMPVYLVPVPVWYGYGRQCAVTTKSNGRAADEALRTPGDFVTFFVLCVVFTCPCILPVPVSYSP
jgi:hypothetical protein